jgi:HAE1 family hydrophobic/amphiphilic exporter-1
MWFTRFSIKNPVFAVMMMAGLFAIGLYAYFQLPTEDLPNVDYPSILISTEYPGAAPEIVESELSRPIEQRLSSIPGIKTISSVSFLGTSQVTAEFELSTNIERALSDVRVKVDEARLYFRKEVLPPGITRMRNADGPVISVALGSTTATPRQMTVKAEQDLKYALQGIKGVSSVTVVGGIKRQLRIEVQPERLRAYGVGINSVIDAIESENRQIPVGNIEYNETERIVQIKGELRELDDFRQMVVARRNGQPVLLGQLADLIDGQEEQKSVALVNGKRAITLDIRKVDGANTIQITDDVKALVAKLNTELTGEAIQLSILGDVSPAIRQSLHEVQKTLLEGALLTVLIVWLFLGSWRSTVITGLTLPISLFGSCIVLLLFGFTINGMTLMALSLCIGLVIDDAIVVRENIMRHAAMGKGRLQAAHEGTAEIGLAVLATTLTIVAVFLPVGFMGGIIGRFLYQFGIAVCAAVLISMFVSFTLDPMLSSVWHDPHTSGNPGGGVLARIPAGFGRWLDRIALRYGRIIGWSLAHRKTTLSLALLSLALAAAIPVLGLVGREFLPKTDQGRLSVVLRTPIGTSLEFTAQKARQVDAALREFPVIAEEYTTINTGDSPAKHIITTAVQLIDKAARPGQEVLIPQIRARLERIGGLQVLRVQETDTGRADDPPLSITVQGKDLAELKRIALELAERLERIPHIASVQTTIRPPKPAIDIQVNRQLAARVGLSVGQIGQTLRPLVAGDPSTTTSWKAPDGESYDVVVQLPKASRQSQGSLALLPLASLDIDPRTGQNILIPLAQVAEIRESSAATLIQRRNLSRNLQVIADVEGVPVSKVQDEVRRAMDGIVLPTGYKLIQEGDNQFMTESFGYASRAVGIGVILMYLILATQFRSFMQPLAIMTSLPLSMIGVFVALMLWHSTLNMFSAIGIIMLMGLVTKNAILLIDFMNRLREEGYGREAAIVEAGKVRLRPILMTTFTMVAGMAPLAFSLGNGSEQRASMAQAIVGGMLTSTLLTLIVLPVVITCLDDFGQWVGNRWRQPEESGPESEPKSELEPMMLKAR